MPNHASAQFIGHLGKDPETRHTQSGTKITGFSLAVKTGFGDRAKTTWWHVATFGKTAEAAESYLRKGDPVMVVGEPFIEEWEDRDGDTRVIPKFNANQIVLPSSKKDGKDDSAAKPVAKRASNDAPFDDEIPF